MSELRLTIEGIKYPLVVSFHYEQPEPPANPVDGYEVYDIDLAGVHLLMNDFTKQAQGAIINALEEHRLKGGKR